eukprot:TRINITY_DN1848_c0_g1_i1.p1 TRINITY_DN1848_c0_g1~~TRINITY_DN1848_c0_g1_i1.p1  ORF type:complete len:139 (-),score=30.49 TRINITY_DN1848_c0_g1_i1:418-834(-)
MASISFRCDDKLQEWSFVELQGSITVASESHLMQSKATKSGIAQIESSFGGIELGKLSLPSSGPPTLLIGNHYLVGEIVSLKKPLVICRKQFPAASTSRTPSNSSTDADAEATMQVLGVVRKKIVFTGRPNPVLDTKV